MPVAYAFDGSDELWSFVSELRGPVSLALANLDPAERARIRAAVEERALAREGGYRLAGVSLNVVTA